MPYLRMYTDLMHRVRRAAGSIAVAWLLCQTATVVLATAIFGVEAVAVKLLECTCAHGTEHSDCPMHHPTASSREGLSQVQCANDADAALLGSLMGQVGLVPTRVGTDSFTSAARLRPHRRPDVRTPSCTTGSPASSRVTAHRCRSEALVCPESGGVVFFAEDL